MTVPWTTIELVFVGDESHSIPVPEAPPSPSLDDVEAEVAELCGTINVATARLVDVLAGLCDSRDWAGVGYRSLEHWATVHCGISPGRAQGLVQLAKRASELPETLGRFRDGALSEDQVRPIARHVPAGFEAAVAKFAQYATANQVSRVARTYSFPEPKEDDRPHHNANGAPGVEHDEDAAEHSQAEQEREQAEREEQERRRRQSARFGFNSDGDWWQAANLLGHDGAAVQKALEAARNELFEERKGAGDVPSEEIQVT